jgi:hypothetical protein
MNDTNKSSSEYPDLSESIIDNLLGKNSINGLFILYSIKESFIRKVSLNLKDFCNSTDIEYDYFNGFSLPLNIFGVFTYKTVQVNGNFEWIIETFNPWIIEKIDSHILQIINANKESHMQFISDDFEKVKGYFEKY